MSDPGQQRLIAIADLLPVVAGHGGIPIEIAFDAPSFVENLAPLFTGIDLDLQAAEFQLALAYFLAGSGFDDSVNGTSFVDELFAFFIEVVAVDAFEENFVFAFSDIVNVQDVVRLLLVIGAELAGFLRSGEVKEFVLASGESAENTGRERDGGDTIADAVQVDLNGLDGLFFFFFS